MTPFLLAREAAAVARSQPAASAVTVLLIAGMTLAILLTSGRTIGAEQQVRTLIDSAGTRSIVIRAEDDAGLTTESLSRLQGLDGIDQAVAFSSAIDATNGAFSGGSRVPVRTLVSATPGSAGGLPLDPLPNLQAAFASSQALKTLGMQTPSGSVTLVDGRVVPIAGTFDTPDYLQQFEPLILVPIAREAPATTINLIVIVASRPQLVSPIADVLIPLLAPTDATKMTVQTSEKLAELRGQVSSELSSFARALVLALLALTSILVFFVLFGLVTMRRRDFGRRRALGASRLLIVELILVQTGLLSMIGVALGAAAGLLGLTISGDPLPNTRFVINISALTFSAATFAALLPAILASGREPARELRVP